MALRTYRILISDSQMNKLRKDVWSEQFVEGVLLYQGNRLPLSIRYRGGHTREYPKKSFEIIAGGRRLHFNAEYDDPSIIRNALSFEFFERIGVPSPRTEHCVLNMNGMNLGIYLQIEAVNRAFFQKRGLSVQSLYYAVNDQADFGLLDPDTKRRKPALLAGYRRIIGSEKDDALLKRFITRLGTVKSTELPALLNKWLDVDNYLHWLAGAVLTGNYDGFDHNYAVYRSSSKLKYRIIPWDYEGTWGRNCYGKRVNSDLVRVNGYNALTEKILAVPSNRSRYKAILIQLLRTEFTINRLGPAIDRMFHSIAPYVGRDTQRRWPVSQFLEEPAYIRRYIYERREDIFRALAKMTDHRRRS
ncbi:CotH kinase family protein [Paenibacillus sp. y28]|uniref:CotH kinase family protein n=1 Tax=Paenibacillus sp. y28 TaxID=3129110 RepID=UPI003019C696